MSKNNKAKIVLMISSIIFMFISGIYFYLISTPLGELPIFDLIELIDFRIVIDYYVLFFCAFFLLISFWLYKIEIKNSDFVEQNVKRYTKLYSDNIYQPVKKYKNEKMTLLIFGAQGYALGAYNAFKTLYPKRLIPCFVVTKMGNNASTLGGITVKEIALVSGSMTVDDKNNTSILIATPENIQPEIEETLEFYGFHNHIRLTSKRWDELMKLYHIKLGQFQPLSALPVGSQNPFVRIFMAKSHVDRPLRQSITLPDYVFPIQVGRENADTRIADIVDNTGDNISERNGNYSELTGLYWLWKNKMCDQHTPSVVMNSETGSGGDDGNGERCGACKRQYYGFGQYRRMLEFTDDDLLRLIDNDVDVVLPYPMPYEPNIHAHHERYIKKSDWDALLQALAELQPEYSECFESVLNQPFLYNYNVILAKKSVLRSYCEWLFPILMRTEELTSGSTRSERYIGYMAETLETLYFMRNSERFSERFGGENGKSGKNGESGSLNIVHTLCRLYV